MKNMTKVMMASVLAIGTLAAGCQNTLSTTIPVAQTVISNALQAYNWQLVDAKRSNGAKITQLFYNPEKPLVLSFMTVDGENRVALMNTCNSIDANYSVINGNIQMQYGVNTAMACPEPEASFDTAAKAVVEGKYSLSKSANNPPVLTITSANQVAQFKAISK